MSTPDVVPPRGEHLVNLPGAVQLKSGEKMVVKRVECPAGDYAEPLANFLEHKRDTTFRDFKQRLRGDYARDSLDRFFVGEIDGEIVSQMGYMLPREAMDVGVFGHVYTARKHRGKGAASILMQYCMDDFNAGEGKALFCGVGQEHAQRLYARYGFTPLFEERAPLGPQGYIRPRLARDFEELQKIFFAPGQPTRIRPAHMGDRPKVDKILLQSDGGRAEMGSRHRSALAGVFSDFVTMFQAMKDKRGPLFMLETDERRVVGYSFAFSAGSSVECDAKFLDFLVHPNYCKQEARLIAETIERTEARSVRLLVPASDERRLTVARAAGMDRECVLSGYCTLGGKPVDLHVLVSR
ncbi:MAG: GNAT family N-acetyltransferase [Planctomycetota bacterium]